VVKTLLYSVFSAPEVRRFAGSQLPATSFLNKPVNWKENGKELTPGPSLSRKRGVAQSDGVSFLPAALPPEVFSLLFTPSCLPVNPTQSSLRAFGVLVANKNYSLSSSKGATAILLEDAISLQLIAILIPLFYNLSDRSKPE
jgi:hypothetical protein